MRPRTIYFLAALLTPVLAFELMEFADDFLGLFFSGHVSWLREGIEFLCSAIFINLILVFFTRPKLNKKEFRGNFISSMALTIIGSIGFIGIFLIYAMLSGGLIFC
jgi:hypothetical protein